MKFHGYDPKDAIIQVSPRENEYTLRMGDIIDIIRKNGDAVALILFSGVQYYTGQWFDLELITKVGHEVVYLNIFNKFRGQLLDSILHMLQVMYL